MHKRISVSFPNYREVKSKLPIAPGFNKPHVLLCFDCLEKRLGRNLRKNDFDLEIPVNAGIKLGIRFSS